MNVNIDTFAAILTEAVGVDTKAAGVTARFFAKAKSLGQWADVQPLIEQAETEHKNEKRGPVPQVWRNAKSTIKAGFEHVIDGADGAKFTVLAVSDSFNDLRVRLAAIKEAKKKAEAAEKADEKAGEAMTGNTGEAAIPDALRDFVLACMADDDVVAGITAERMSALFDALKADIEEGVMMAEIAALETEVQGAVAH